MNNQELHKNLLTFNDPEIICVTETHAKSNDIMRIDGYEYFGVCRKTDGVTMTHRGSGGCGIFVKKSLENRYEIICCFKLSDNVVGIRIKCHVTSEYVIIYCVYLPPDSSKYGQNNETVLNYLTIEMYKCVNAKNVFLCGDFNARTGTKMNVAIVRKQENAKTLMSP